MHVSVGHTVYMCPCVSLTCTIVLGLYIHMCFRGVSRLRLGQGKEGEGMQGGLGSARLPVFGMS